MQHAHKTSCLSITKLLLLLGEGEGGMSIVIPQKKNIYKFNTLAKCRLVQTLKQAALEVLFLNHLKYLYFAFKINIKIIRIFPADLTQSLNK